MTDARVSDGQSAESSLPASQTAKPICILVLGMHRSGTSCFTRLINLLGARLPETLMGAGEGNETGHWEPARLVQFNDSLLGKLGSRWDDWRRLELHLIPAQHRAEIKSDIAGHLASDYRDAPLIVVKDPRICRFTPLYLEALDEVGYDTRVVIPFRNPLEVAASLERRRTTWSSEQSPTYAALLWLRHVLDAEVATRGRLRVIQSYDALLDDWKSACAEITRFTAIAWPYSIEEVQSRAAHFVDSELRHNRRTPEDVLLEPSTKGWVADAYETLHVLERNPQSAPALATLDGIRREFEHATTVMVQLLSEERARHRAEAEKMQTVIAEREDEVQRLAGLLSERERELHEQARGTKGLLRPILRKLRAGRSSLR